MVRFTLSGEFVGRKLVGSYEETSKTEVIGCYEAQTLSFTGRCISGVTRTCCLILPNGRVFSLAFGGIRFRRHEENYWQYWGGMKDDSKKTGYFICDRFQTSGDPDYETSSVREE
jgi:hypothetical protein